MSYIVDASYWEKGKQSDSYPYSIIKYNHTESD